MEVQFAIYPGTVTLYNGMEVTLTAEELAILYGVDDEDYLTVETNADIPQGMDYLNYIHLKPRADGVYVDMKDADHTQLDEWIGRDFDGSRKYTQETKHPYDDLME